MENLKLSYVDKQKSMNLRPTLLIGGISFFVSAGIVIHSAINDMITPVPIPYFEVIISAIFLLLGFGSIVILLVQIGIVFEKHRKKVITTIVLLLLFISFRLVQS